MEYLQHLLMRSLWVVLVVMLAVENGCNGCLEKERIALLQLKDSINFASRIDRLPSWEEDDNTDCCHWERVECSSTTRRVIKLELNYTRERGVDGDWHLNASILLPFESLRSLNLFQNQLHSFVGNEGIGTLSNLHYLEELDLAGNYLDNSILPSLNKLSNLKILNLAGNELNGSILAKGIEIFPNFGNLEELDLSYNYHLGNSILLSLNKLSNLKSLRLAGISFYDSIYVEGIGILSNLTNLEELDLSHNNLGNGILPSLNHFSNLKNLNLAGTELNGSIYVKGIGILSNLTNLEELDLSRNDLGNGIQPSLCIGILSNLTNLEKLDLSQNNLGNGILPSLNKLSNLKFLQLAANNLNGSIYVKGSQEESGILKKLEVLDLSGNEALNNSVWSFLGGLSSIKTLDLSYNRGLHGAVYNKDLRNISNIETLLMDGVMLDDVLPYIRFITSIQVLSLTYCDSKRIPSIAGLCELKKLRELDITGSDFGETLPWCLANLTSLQLLDLTSNHFTGNIASSPLINLTSLEYLAISDNDFEVPISFKSFFNHSKLVFIKSLNNMLLEEEDFLATSPSFQLIGLCLSSSEHGHIHRSFPRFLYHQHDLTVVKLSDFTGKFPYWLLDNNTRMETLFLSYNSFGGQLLLPSHPMRNLTMLDITNNHLEGFLPFKLASSFPSLEFLNMSTNNFEGNIPSSFGDMTALKTLDLSNNNLSGEIPVHLAKGCRHLKFLRLSNNILKGPVLPHQNNLTLLEVLYSANNSFTEIPPNLSRSILIILDVSANKLVGKIPVGFIGNNTWLTFLAMAGNHLEGPIPIEFCRLEGLVLLDLSENYITGAVPSCFSSSRIYNIRLSKNRLDGPFPMAFKNYSTSLMELDLSYNQFSGTIPTWIGSLSELTVLLLQNNNFEGNIPKELCNVSRLTMVDLSFNNLFGSIPPCISEIEFNGTNVDGGVYFFSLADSAQTFTLLLHDLGMVLAKSEKDRKEYFIEATGQEAKFTTKGMSLTYRGIVLHLFSGINLSHNRLTGPIPPEIGNLTHLKVLNLSHNNFIGTIPVTFSNLKGIECLDLSYNRLNGIIPSELTVLNSLAVFNLSYNNLSGRMPPRVNQFGTFESSSYVGNPHLCGEPLPMKCNATDSPPSMPRAAMNDTEEDSGFMDMTVFYMSFAGSYITVVLAIVAILLINPYWRSAWFHLLEVSITSCYYFVVDNLVGRRHCFLWK